MALVVRVLTGLPALAAPTFSDETVFHDLARRLAAGEGFSFVDGQPTCWRPPLQPAVMAVVYALRGPSPAAARLFQMLLGTLLVGAIWLLGRQLRDEDERVAALAGWWAALSPTLIYYSHTLFSETLFGLLFTLGLTGLLAARRTGRDGPALAAGVALGLACLTRGSTLLFVPPAMVWLALGQGRPRWRPALGLGLAYGLIVAPWTVRNLVTQGGLVVVDSNGPLNFFWGNHPEAPPLRPWDIVERDPRPWPAVAPGADELATQRAALKETLGFIAARPGRFLGGLLVKTGNLWGLDRGLGSGVSAGLYGPPRIEWIVLATGLDGLVGLGLLLLGVLGAGLTRDRAAAELTLLVMLTLTLVHAVSYGHSRYRFGALPLLGVLAAVAWTRRDRWRAELAALPRARGRATRLALVLLALNWLYEALYLELIARFG